MIKKISSLLILMLSSAYLMAGGGVVVIEGKYQNKNIFVQNSYTSSGIGFCAFEVLVNGQVTTDDINSSAFEIDLANYALKPGSPVVVQIRYKNGCAPVVLNPDALKPKPTFQIEEITINKSGKLEWSTTRENGSLPFIVEQFIWNKWVYVGEVQGVGTPDLNKYSFQTIPHSGENKFRVKQMGYGAKPIFSQSVSYVSNLSQLSYALTKNSNEVMFSAETMYEVYDAYGNIVKKGFGKSIDTRNLQRGSYHLCYDSQITEFKKK